jgi:hypothetical protein
VHLDEPELVVAAIVNTADTARKMKEIRLAENRQTPVVPVTERLLLVSSNYLQPLYHSITITFHNIYDARGKSAADDFVLPQ